MDSPLIGLDAGDFRMEIKAALGAVAEMGCRAVELPAIGGDIDPDRLTASGRRHLLRLAEGLGLGIVALTADLPGLRFSDPRSADERVHRTMAVMQLARDLSVPVVAAGVAALTDPESGGPIPLAVAALQRIGECADSLGVRYAVRPLSDNGKSLAAVLDVLGCPSLGVCLDPAAMVMSGVSPLASIELYVEQVSLFHARDGSAGGRDASGAATRFGQETALGEGEVDMVGVLAMLEAADYAGPYILRRSQSSRPNSDLRFARDALLRLLSH